MSPLVTFTLIKLLADNLTLSVSVLLHDDGDEIDQCPNTATTACAELNDTINGLTCIEAMYTECTQEPAQQKCGQPTF